MYVYCTHVVKEYWNNGLSCLVWLWQWSKASRFYFLREKTMQCWLHVTNRALSTKTILSRKMILAGREEHVKIRCPVKLQLCVSKVCSDCGTVKVRRICLYGDMGTTVAPQSQWSVFPYKSLYILYVFKFFNCNKTFPLCIIGLKFSYVHNRKAL